MGADREPPSGMMGTPEAADILKVSQQTIRNWLRSGHLKGMGPVVEPDGATRYWAEMADVERLRLEREAEGKQVAEVIHDELSESREIVIETMRRAFEEVSEQAIARIVDAIVDQRDDLHKEINRQREQVTGELRRLAERQSAISADLERAVEILGGEAERHAEQVEREKEFQARTIQLQERWLENGGRAPMGRVFGYAIMALLAVAVVLLCLIAIWTILAH